MQFGKQFKFFFACCNCRCWSHLLGICSGSSLLLLSLLFYYWGSFILSQVLVNVLALNKNLSESLSLGRLHPQLQSNTLQVDSEYGSWVWYSLEVWHVQESSTISIAHWCRSAIAQCTAPHVVGSLLGAADLGSDKSSNLASSKFGALAEPCCCPGNSPWPLHHYLLQFFWMLLTNPPSVPTHLQAAALSFPENLLCDLILCHCVYPDKHDCKHIFTQTGYDS